eukprot:COSAG01_NODE_2060_length_8520_cov_4.178839_11_plen_74_part_00
MTASLHRFVKPRATTGSLHVMGCTNVCMWMCTCVCVCARACVCGALQLEDECVAAAEKASGAGVQHDRSIAPN